MLRDRLVVGIRDATLSDKLQLDATLTLEKVKIIVRQKAVREHRDELTPGKQHGALEDVTRKTSGTNCHCKGSTSSKLRTAPTATKCQCCGRNKHESLDECPARNVICHRCKKKGHFKAHCQSKVAASTSEVQADDLAFLGTLATEGNSTWRSMHCQSGRK